MFKICWNEIIIIVSPPYFHFGSPNLSYTLWNINNQGIYLQTRFRKLDEQIYNQFTNTRKTVWDMATLRNTLPFSKDISIFIYTSSHLMSSQDKYTNSDKIDMSWMVEMQWWRWRSDWNIEWTDRKSDNNYIKIQNKSIYILHLLCLHCLNHNNNIYSYYRLY